MEAKEWVKHADDGNFEVLVIAADQPTLVDFWAPWCGPCRAIAPVVEELAREYTGRVQVVKVNVDDCPETASRYNVRSIPTLSLFKGGKVLETRVGMAKQEELAALLNRGIGS